MTVLAWILAGFTVLCLLASAIMAICVCMFSSKLSQEEERRIFERAQKESVEKDEL